MVLNVLYVFVLKPKRTSVFLAFLERRQRERGMLETLMNALVLPESTTAPPVRFPGLT